MVILHEKSTYTFHHRWLEKQDSKQRRQLDSHHSSSSSSSSSSHSGDSSGVGESSEDEVSATLSLVATAIHLYGTETLIMVYSCRLIYMLVLSLSLNSS